jgi:hypothetical protein
MPLRQRQEIQELLRTLIILGTPSIARHGKVQFVSSRAMLGAPFEIAAFDICAPPSLDF